MANNIERDNFVKAWDETHGRKEPLTRKQVMELAEENNLKTPWWVFQKYGRGRNQFSIANYGVAVPQEKWGDRYRKKSDSEIIDVKVVQHETAVKKVDEKVTFVPTTDPLYVRTGFYKELVQIMKSGLFMPTFITGQTGMGKTKECYEAAASTKQELIRVNITVETDEDDLLGHYTLKDGETVWEDGPVIVAMERGAQLLLDEIDLASNKIMCLQPVLEGGPIFLKKTNRLVSPAPGFNIIATANTKGRGNDDGRFIGTNILNEAFLDRFPITFEQDYPAPSVERKIISKLLEKYNVQDDAFVEHLVQWADVIRRTFVDGGIDEIISTRRLINIVNAYAIFQNKEKAIEYCINRFDDDTKKGFMDLWSKVDPDATSEEIEDENMPPSLTKNEVPYEDIPF